MAVSTIVCTENRAINYLDVANATMPSTLAAVTTDCPPPSQIFHGRTVILQELHSYFSQNIGRRHVCVLHGLGGAGKTQLALKFLDETNNSR
jgi:hypothetical protein